MLRKLSALLGVLILQGGLLSNMEAKTLQLQKNITGVGLSPKSVVHAGKGLFFAQNMMYNHNISVYNRNFERIKIINDAVDLSKYGFKGYQGQLQGAPVECAFSHNGGYAWVSNYQMYGKGFNNAGEDNCKTSNDYDHSFLYKINTQSLAIEDVVKVGAVPKYVAVTPDSRYVLVSNWCSGDVTIVDTKIGKAIKSVPMGAHPRGMVVDNRSEKVYVAVMGSNKIGVIHLKDFSVSWLTNVGSTPRHLCISPDNNFLYVTLNSEGKVAKIDLRTGRLLDKVRTGNAPRSMAMLGNGTYLYVVNYFSNTMSKVRAADMKVVETVSTQNKPIGVTTDAEAQTVWVACYSGSIMVFQDTELKNNALSNIDKHANTPQTIVEYMQAADAQKPFVGNNVIKSPPITASIAPNNANDTQKQVVKTPPSAVVKPRPVVGTTVANNGPSSGFYIIVGSCASRSKAEQAVAQWKKKGASKAQVVASNNHFRIAINYYKTKNEANQAIAQAQNKYTPEAWILEHSEK